MNPRLPGLIFLGGFLAVLIVVLVFQERLPDSAQALPEWDRGGEISEAREMAEERLTTDLAPDSPIDIRDIQPPWQDSNRRLFDAIAQVESGGDDSAVGDGGLSKGRYQITEPFWRDGCEAGGVTWDYETHVWNPRRCEYVMWSVWARYGATTDQQKAKLHNAGVGGMNNPNLQEYWRRVEGAMTD